MEKVAFWHWTTGLSVVCEDGCVRLRGGGALLGQRAWWRSESFHCLFKIDVLGYNYCTSVIWVRMGWRSFILSGLPGGFNPDNNGVKEALVFFTLSETILPPDPGGGSSSSSSSSSLLNRHNSDSLLYQRWIECKTGSPHQTPRTQQRGPQGRTTTPTPPDPDQPPHCVGECGETSHISLVSECSHPTAYMRYTCMNTHVHTHIYSCVLYILHFYIGIYETFFILF